MKYLTIKALLLGALLSPTVGLSQHDEGFASATITDEYCVSLDTDLPIAEFYEIDISHLELASETEALNKFGYINNNLLTYTVNFAAEKAYLQIHLDRTAEPMDILWWNDYINSLCGL